MRIHLTLVILVTDSSPHRRGREHPPPPNSGATEDEDYYNSYYSTLVHSPLRQQFDVHRSSEDLPSSHTLHDRTSPSSHPYATYQFPVSGEDRVPHSAPIVSTNSNDFDPFRSMAMRPSQSTGPALASSTLLHPRLANLSLKNSVSSPDLRNARRSPVSSQTKPLTLLKGRERWLSPETWCDALFLPRPRFKVKQDGSINYGNRVVSPPGSPVATQFRPADMVSRVVAHSKSMVDLKQRQDPGPSTYIPRDLPPAPSGKPPRPKSFALDDLALPSPAPSLSRYVDLGHICCILTISLVGSWRKVRYWNTSARSGKCKRPIRSRIAEPGIFREHAPSRYRRSRRAWTSSKSTRAWTSWLRDHSQGIRTRYLFSREVQLKVAMEPPGPMLIRTP